MRLISSLPEAKIESWVRLVKVACLSFLEIVRWGVYEPMNK
jgi:hypothetical protein